MWVAPIPAVAAAVHRWVAGMRGLEANQAASVVAGDVLAVQTAMRGNGSQG